MPDHPIFRKSFINNFIISAKSEGVPLNKTELREFLQEQDVDFECPYSLAGAALHYFCDGRGQDLLTTKAILAFLTEVLDQVCTAHDIETLANRLAAPGRTREDLISWVRGAYPS